MLDFALDSSSIRKIVSDIYICGNCDFKQMLTIKEVRDACGTDYLPVNVFFLKSLFFKKS